MKVPSSADNELCTDCEVEVGFDYVSKLHRLLANLYLHVCPLPDPKAVVQTICDNDPHVHCNGVMSLVHIFVVLMSESPHLEKLAKATMYYKSCSMSSAFGAGDEFEKKQSPMTAFVAFVIEQDKGISHEVVVHLLDYVYGVILYNNVSPDRVEAISDLLTAIDDFYFDLSKDGKHARQACVACMTEDAFVARIYHCFGVMDAKGMLERECTDEASEKGIVSALSELLKICPGDDVDVDVDDADDEVESSSDNELKFCDDDNDSM